MKQAILVLAHGIYPNRHYEWCYDLEGHVIEFFKNPMSIVPALVGIMPLERLPDSEELVAAWAEANFAKAKANAAWAKLQVANTEADTAWDKAVWIDSDNVEEIHAAMSKADIALIKADTAKLAWSEADIKANAAWEKVDSVWDRYVVQHPDEVQALHDELWPNCTWNGEGFVDSRRVS